MQNMKCKDWYSRIILDNSGFNSKVCKDVEKESKLLDTENQIIVVQFDPSIKIPEKNKNGLGAGEIAGIVVGVVAVIVIVVVVVIIVLRKKIPKLSENEDADTNNESGAI